MDSLKFLILIVSFFSWILSVKSSFHTHWCRWEWIDTNRSCGWISNISYFLSPPSRAQTWQTCRSEAFGGLSVDNRGAVYFPVCLCFVTLSTMSVSRCVIIWRQRPEGGAGGAETASSFSCCEPRPVPPEAACLLKSSQETLGPTFNPLDHPKTTLSEESWSSGGVKSQKFF